jgi:molecular chaperone HscB
VSQERSWREIMDPFETLGIEPSFDVDLPALEQRYRELSRVVHPDKFAKSGARERRLAVGKAVDVNAAYRVLKDPVRRAEALLVRYGVSMDERAQPKAPPELLMEMMELREDLASAKEERDVARVKTLSDQVRARRERVVGALSQAFSGLSPASATHRAALSASAVALVGELKYLVRFLDEVKLIEDDVSSFVSSVH